jgi:hypothetical protein
MRRFVLVLLAVAAGAGIGAVVLRPNAAGSPATAPIRGFDLPPAYRDWRLISVAREAGALDDVRAILGNDVAIRAFRDGTMPFPDGAIIARLAWSLDPSIEVHRAFGTDQTFVAGEPKNGVQFMVKDSKRYASTGGWGFAQFDDGKPAPHPEIRACSKCHAPDRGRDSVFTRYAR